MTALLVAVSVLFVVGVSIAVLPATGAPTLRWQRGTGRKLGARTLAAVGLGGTVVLLSGWVIPGVVVAIGAAWAVAGWQRRQGTRVDEIARLDALASWIENVRDVLTAGEQPIGAINASVAACSPAIRTPVRRLAVALGRQDPELAFRRFADDLDDPLGDLVAAGLSIAIRRGARTVPVLTALAEQTRHHVERRRLVEAERAPTRREVHALTMIMGGLVFGLLVFGRSEYLAAYDSTAGQVFLAIALAGYAALIVRVQRLATFPRPNRFLSASAGPAATEPRL
jgi:hypothetical protein